jgi:serine/threonine protein phosphatase PrpC
MIATYDEATVPSDVVRLFGDLAVPSRRRCVASSSGAASACGSARHQNEDTYGSRSERVFVVADGMGGRPGGALASATAVATALELLGQREGIPDWRAVVSAVNDAVRTAATAAGHLRSGAALGLVALYGSRATIVHLGDVRIYRSRRGAVERLTIDHTIDDELSDAGFDVRRAGLRPAELAALTVYLGDANTAQRFALRTIGVEPDDRLVVCTDGVHRHREPVPGDLHGRPDSVVAKALVDGAIANGSTDDATAVVVTLGFGGRRE